METYDYTIEEELVDERLDKFLSEQFKEYSRSFIQGLIKDGQVQVNGEAISKKNYRLRLDDEIEIQIPAPSLLEVSGQEMDLDIVYEDDALLVVNKPQGMVVHPAPGHDQGTLVNGLMYYADRLSSINGVIRPGIVHRIDKDTSGLLMVAKTDEAHHHLSDLLKDHDIERAYLALVHGKVKEGQTIHKPIARNPKNRLKMGIVPHGKEATTHVMPLEIIGPYTLVRCTLETGRTHQIRVHLTSIGHPILGDPLYGVKKEEIKHEGQLLHASRLGFTHPVTGELMSFEAPLPQYFEEILGKLRRKYEVK